MGRRSSRLAVRRSLAVHQRQLRSRVVSIEPTQDAQPAIENLMDERRTFVPDARLRRPGQREG